MKKLAAFAFSGSLQALYKCFSESASSNDLDEKLIHGLAAIDRIYTNILRTLCESVIIKTEKEDPSLAAASSHGYEIHRSRLGRRGGFSFAA
mgnify:FL=1